MPGVPPLLPQSFLAVPIIASGSSGSIIGALSFGLTSITDWGSAWWMGSIQLLCGWAAGALPQNRASARACFFDALWGARDLDELGRCFVHQLPQALVDPVSTARAALKRQQQQQHRQRHRQWHMKLLV
jgi:hypothetical protein